MNWENIKKFRDELEKEFGMVGHPVADKLWQKAWERGHACGLQEVRWEYEDLHELVSMDW